MRRCTERSPQTSEGGPAGKTADEQETRPYSASGGVLEWKRARDARTDEKIPETPIEIVDADRAALLRFVPRSHSLFIETPSLIPTGYEPNARPEMRTAGDAQ